MTSLNLLSTDVEDSLRATVRSLLASRCTPDRVTAVYDGDDSVRGPLWAALAGGPRPGRAAGPRGVRRRRRVGP